MGLLLTAAVQTDQHSKMVFLILFAGVAFAISTNAINSSNFSNATVDLKMCDYAATCSAGGYGGVCVSIGGGCCSGGTVTSGLCPGM
jgi:hypothetical protein